LRQVLDEHPELWNHFGNLALQTQERWLQLIAGKDLYLAESLRRHLDAMRTELAGPDPSPLDRLLVDRVLANHVQVLYFEAMEATDPTAENMRVARYRMDRRDQAHRQFLSAVKVLATVRNLVARTQTIRVELLNPMMAHSPAASAVPVAHVEQFPACTDRMNGREHCFDADVAQLVNGREQCEKLNGNGKRLKKGSVNGSVRSIHVHRLNGNRVAHLLETASPGTGE